MNEDPVEWLTGQWELGVHLREEGRYLRTQDTDDWERRAEKWAQELRDGIAIRKQSDVGRVKTLGCFVVEDLPPEHPYHDSSILPWPHMTATGEGRPSNTPYSRHSALVAEVEKILNEWRAVPPKQHDSPGRKRIIHTDGIKLARKLLQEKTATSNSEAALMAVKKLGHGPHASDDAAIQSIRRKISLL